MPEPEPISVDPAQLFDFVADPGLAVLFVSVHPAHRFNRALSQRLASQHPDTVTFGSIAFMDLVLSGGPALPFLQQGLEACGGPSAFGVLPGYWLVRRSEVLAWDLGLPTAADARTMAHGALLGAIWSGLTRNLSFVAQALRLAADEVAAQRMAVAFRAATMAADQPEWRRPPPASGPSRPPPGSPHPPRPPWTTDDELLRAYQTLGVSPAATDQEVQQAWRRRRVELHPDGAARDPAEFARRSRISVELNRARDVIFAHRGGTAGRRRA
jgi:hypothetical protein